MPGNWIKIILYPHDIPVKFQFPSLRMTRNLCYVSQRGWCTAAWPSGPGESLTKGWCWYLLRANVRCSKKTIYIYILLIIINIHIYIYMCVCKHTHTHTYMYMYMYTYIYIIRMLILYVTFLIWVVVGSLVKEFWLWSCTQVPTFSLRLSPSTSGANRSLIRLLCNKVG